MQEEHLSSAKQSIIGRYNALVYGSGAATVTVYESIVPRPVVAEVIASAQEKLTSLPLDHTPVVRALPPTSRPPAFARNPSFVGRETELAQIATLLKAHDLATVAITGLGGVGKSQLATEFVYRYGQYFEGGVFWLSASNAGALPAEIAQCAVALTQELRLDVRTLPVEEQVQLVCSCWQNPLPRLLLLDNCEDEKLLARWRPPTGGCRVLITSRSGVWHPDLGVSVVPLGVLPRDKSIALLGIYRSDLSIEDRELIAQELGDLPLALSLAGFYLREYQESFLGTPQHYVQALRQASPLEHSSLQQEGDTYTTGHSQHVARTFALSYEQLNSSDTIDATALQLLARIAYFAEGDPIPRNLLRSTIGPENDEEVEDRFVKSLKRVRALGLLTTQQSGACRMHRLLAFFVRQRITSTPVAREAQSAVEEVILSQMREKNNVGYPAPLLPLEEHLRAVVNRSGGRGDTMTADLDEAFGEYLQMTGGYRQAQPYFAYALWIREKSLRSESLASEHHWAAISGLYKLANWAAFGKGDVEDAEIMYQKALDIWEQHLEPEHPGMTYLLYGLAILYIEQGKLEDAEQMLRRALHIWEQHVGSDHPHVAYPLFELTLLYGGQGKLKDAERTQQRVLHIWEQHLGVDHPLIAYLLHALAILYVLQGKLEDAERMQQHALCIWEQRLGSENFHAQKLRDDYIEMLRDMTS